MSKTAASFRRKRAICRGSVLQAGRTDGVSKKLDTKQPRGVKRECRVSGGPLGRRRARQKILHGRDRRCEWKVRRKITAHQRWATPARGSGSWVHPLDAQTRPDCRARKYAADNGRPTREGQRENGLSTIRSSQGEEQACCTTAKSGIRTIESSFSAHTAHQRGQPFRKGCPLLVVEAGDITRGGGSPCGYSRLT